MLKDFKVLHVSHLTTGSSNLQTSVVGDYKTFLLYLIRFTMDSCESLMFFISIFLDLVLFYCMASGTVYNLQMVTTGALSVVQRTTNFLWKVNLFQFLSPPSSDWYMLCAN